MTKGEGWNADRLVKRQPGFGVRSTSDAALFTLAVSRSFLASLASQIPRYVNSSPWFSWRLLIDFVWQHECPVLTDNVWFINLFENELQSTKEQKPRSGLSQHHWKYSEAGGLIPTLNAVTLRMCHVLEETWLFNVINYVCAFMLWQGKMVGCEKNSLRG